MRFVSTRGRGRGVLSSRALRGPGARRRPVRPGVDRAVDLDGEAWPSSSWSLAEMGTRVLGPFVGGDLDDNTLASIVASALNFPIPLVEVEPGAVTRSSSFTGRRWRSRTSARASWRASWRRCTTGGAPLTVLVATSGDTGGAVAHAFHDVPHTRVVILYPDGRVSPTQEAQLTMFNGEATNVRAYAVAGSFDDCQRLTKEAFADADLRPGAADIGQLDQRRPAAAADDLLRPRRGAADGLPGARRSLVLPCSRRRAATSATSRPA